MATHEVVSIRRGQTKHGDPMWTCATRDGARVNVFRNPDPARDTFGLFAQAGYGALLDGMQPGEEQVWRYHPIAVTLFKDGAWWAVRGVEARTADAAPDPRFVPDARLYRQAAQRWAERLMTLPVVVIDTETTGTSGEDEIVQLAALDFEHGLAGACVPLVSLVCPSDPRRAVDTEPVHHLDPARIAEAPTLAALYDRLRFVLEDRAWLIFNAAFDVPMLERAIRRALSMLPPPAKRVVAPNPPPPRPVPAEHPPAGSASGQRKPRRTRKGGLS